MVRQMTVSALDHFLEQARALPGEKAEAGLPRAADGGERTVVPRVVLDGDALRKRVSDSLRTLARRVEAELPKTMARAARAWEQVDSLAVLDRATVFELRVLRRAARLLESDADAVHRAIALEVALTLDVVLGLISLLERRMAVLARLQLRSDQPALVDDAGHPFLDLGPALSEVARAWR